MPTSASLIVSWQSTNLYHADLQLLQSPTAWLNDACITYAYDCLQYSVIPLTRSTNNKPAIDPSTLTVPVQQSPFRFVSPLTSFFLLHEEDIDDVRDAIDGLDIVEQASSPTVVTRLLFLPVNNTTDVVGGGGSHWSLLVIDLSQQAACHYDSYQGSGNRPIAHQLWLKLQPLLFADSISTGSAMSEVTEVQQGNGYDCGMYSIAFAQHIAAYTLTSKSQTALNSPELVKCLQQHMTPPAVRQLRAQLVQKAYELQKLLNT